MDFQLHLETESVEQAHPTKPVCVQPSDSIRHVMRVLKSSATSAAMVCREGKLEGIFTERDALRQLADGSDLDVPGSMADDKDEAIGEEDEENNYYSLGGDLHESQEENKGE